MLHEKKANACLDEGADVALMWIRPHFHSSPPQQGMNSVSATQTNQSVNQPGSSEDLIPESELREILDNFRDVLSDVPAGLPLDRGVGHTIPLEPGSKPPFRPIYRLSPKELEEAK